MGASLEVGMDTVDGVSHRDSFVGRFFFGFWDKKGERRGPRGFGAGVPNPPRGFGAGVPNRSHVCRTVRN